MNKTKVYIPEPKDIIDKFKIDNLVSKGALQPVERYVLEEKSMIDLLDKYKASLLKNIASTFLTPSNQDKADRETDRHVFQAIGETIENFPFDSALFLNPLTT